MGGEGGNLQDAAPRQVSRATRSWTNWRTVDLFVIYRVCLVFLLLPVFGEVRVVNCGFGSRGFCYETSRLYTFLCHVLV